jgi:hypothetical protein
MLDKIKNFIGDYVSEEHLKLHMSYKTCLWLEKKNKVVAYVQWNIDNATAHITYLKISPEVNSMKVMAYFIREGKRKHPFVKHMIFERETIGDTRKRCFKI